jgi:hypothetical protein
MKIWKAWYLTRTIWSNSNWIDMNSDQISNVLFQKKICYLIEIFFKTLVDEWSIFGWRVPYFFWIFKIRWILYHLDDHLSQNTEPIEPKLNVNLWINMLKYYVDWEIMNSSISVFHPFANSCLYLIKFENIWFIIIWF